MRNNGLNYMCFVAAFRPYEMRLRICIAAAICAMFLIRASAQQSPPTSSSEKDQRPVGRSTIRGRAIYADTGRPLRRAEVHLRTENNDEVHQPSITDRNGEFILKNLSAGKYLVLVTAPDLASPVQRRRGNYSLKESIALGQIDDGYSEVTVDGRNSVKTEIRASRGGVITGRVITETDEPIAKAKIKLFEVENGRIRPSNLSEYIMGLDKSVFETDSRGIYRIAGLASGEYIVRASESNAGGNADEAAEGSYTNGSAMVAFHPKALRIQEATSVKVQQGSETTDVDIRFTERIPHRVSGTALVRGKGVRGVQVKLLRDEPHDEMDRDGLTDTLSDDNGHWEIQSIPDGNYTIVVSGRYLNSVFLPDEQRYISVVPLRRELTLAGGDVTDLKFDLVEGGTVAGVVNAEGETKLPYSLRIRLVSSDTRGPAPKRTGDDETGGVISFVRNDGSFLVTPLLTGSFHFRVSGLGDDFYVKSILLNEKDVLRNPVKVEVGKLLDGVRIVLSSDLVSVSGKAVDKNDRSKPLTNAALLLVPAEAAQRRMSDGPLIARTDKEGRFVVKGAPGDYFVFVVDRGRKDEPAVIPTEATLIEQASTLQKMTLQLGGQKIVEVVGPYR